MDRHLVRYLLVAILLFSIAQWVVPLSSAGDIETSFAYSVQPAEERSLDYDESDVLAFEALSDEAQEGFERAVESDDGTYVTSDGTGLPDEFAFATGHTALGHGIYVIEYDGETYELHTANTTPPLTMTAVTLWLLQYLGKRVAVLIVILVGVRVVWEERRQRRPTGSE